MNKFLLILIFLSGLCFSSEFFSSTDYRTDIPTIVEEGFIAELVVDVQVDTQDTKYSRAYDIARMPLDVSGDSGGVLVENFDGGAVTYSCYDNSEDTGDDSVNVTIAIQGSDYSGGPGGSNPFKAKSDTWAEIASETILTVSNDGAIVEATETFTLPDEAVRFVRWSILNNSTEAINNHPRCRVYWLRRARSQ